MNRDKIHAGMEYVVVKKQSMESNSVQSGDYGDPRAKAP
jgi:hypothetical protein